MPVCETAHLLETQSENPASDLTEDETAIFAERLGITFEPEADVSAIYGDVAFIP